MSRYCPKCFSEFHGGEEVCPEHGLTLVSLGADELLGSVIDGKYTIIEKLGAGGMGVVYVAQQEIIDRRVALKVLRPDIMADERALKRFVTEARAIADLTSSHTIRLLDFGIARHGFIYYTMNLLHGQTMASLLGQQGPLQPELAVDLISQACESLAEAHGKNILHRDIKPSNLFISHRNDEPFLTVLDFGIAKIVGDDKRDCLTETGSLCGTPAYLSPEQVLGQQVCPASDLYSLAVVLFEMLTGCQPFKGETPMKTMLQHLNDPAPRLLDFRPGLQNAEDWQRFLARALAKNPAERYSSAMSFSASLRAIVGQKGQANPPQEPTTSYSGLEAIRSAADGRSNEATGSDAGAVALMGTLRPGSTNPSSVSHQTRYPKDPAPLHGAPPPQSGLPTTNAQRPLAIRLSESMPDSDGLSRPGPLIDTSLAARRLSDVMGTPHYGATAFDHTEAAQSSEVSEVVVVGDWPEDPSLKSVDGEIVSTEEKPAAAIRGGHGRKVSWSWVRVVVVVLVAVAATSVGVAVWSSANSRVNGGPSGQQVQSELATRIEDVFSVPDALVGSASDQTTAARELANGSGSSAEARVASAHKALLSADFAVGDQVASNPSSPPKAEEGLSKPPVAEQMVPVAAIASSATQAPPADQVVVSGGQWLASRLAARMLRLCRIQAWVGPVRSRLVLAKAEVQSRRPPKQTVRPDKKALDRASGAKAGADVSADAQAGTTVESKDSSGTTQGGNTPVIRLRDVVKPKNE